MFHIRKSVYLFSFLSMEKILHISMVLSSTWIRWKDILYSALDLFRPVWVGLLWLHIYFVFFCIYREVKRIERVENHGHLEKNNGTTHDYTVKRNSTIMFTMWEFSIGKSLVNKGTNSCSGFKLDTITESLNVLSIMKNNYNTNKTRITTQIYFVLLLQQNIQINVPLLLHWFAYFEKRCDQFEYII